MAHVDLDEPGVHRAFAKDKGRVGGVVCPTAALARTDPGNRAGLQAHVDGLSANRGFTLLERDPAFTRD
jgi:hypothetical protein